MKPIITLHEESGEPVKLRADMVFHVYRIKGKPHLTGIQLHNGGVAGVFKESVDEVFDLVMKAGV